MIENLALEFLRKNNESIEDYDGCCGELTDGMIHWLGEDRVSILYIKPQLDIYCIQYESFLWAYHMVAVVDGLVHCAWIPHLILKPVGYIMKAFPKQKLEYEVRT